MYLEKAFEAVVLKYGSFNFWYEGVLWSANLIEVVPAPPTNDPAPGPPK